MFCEPQQKHSGIKGIVRSAAQSYLSSTSMSRWRQIFSECDGDKDELIDRRELLVLLWRLDVSIPSDDYLRRLFDRYDVAENGVLDFGAFCSLVRDLDSTAYSPGWTSERSTVGALRRWMAERRGIRLWKELFASLDTYPQDGYLGVDELTRAFQMAGLPVEQAQVQRQFSKYDTNGDGQLDFAEFSRMATDLISSSVQYERALRAAAVRLGGLETAAARAEQANARLAEADAQLGQSALQEIERGIRMASFTEAIGVRQAQVCVHVG